MKPYTQAPDEHAIISADHPTEYGTLDGNTIKVRPYDIGDSNTREDEFWSQVHFPQFWRCSRCGITKDVRQKCMAPEGHDWRRT
jgi:hypothetical protein